MSKPMYEVWAEKAAEQWKIILGLAAVVLVVIAGMGISNEMRSRREASATNSLYEAQLEARKAEKKPEVAERAFQKVIDAHKGTRAAFEAELQAGDAWMDAANYDKAVGHYQKAGDESSDSFSKLLSIYNVGIARESQGKMEDAVKAYEQALAISGSDFLRPEILMAQARCYEALNQGAKAIEIYKTVEEKYASRSYYSGAASAFEKQLSSKKL
jgi:tetratricopeptide (TPR) repeat protein